LTPVWDPDADHEAMRDLIRLRSVVRQIVSFLLRHGRKHGRGTTWRMAYRRWLSTLAFEHPAQQIAFQGYVDAVMDAERRLQPVEEQISGLLPEWNLRPVVDALQAMRGIALITAMVLVISVCCAPSLLWSAAPSRRPASPLGVKWTQGAGSQPGTWRR